MKYNFHPESVVPNEELSGIRGKAFRKLVQLFPEANPLQKMILIDCLERATDRGEGGKELEKLILKNTDDFIDFTEAQADNETNPRILLHFEHALVGILHQYPDIKKAKDVLKRIRKLESYKTYRQLVGREHLYNMMQDPSIKETEEPDLDSLLKYFAGKEPKDTIEELNGIAKTHQLSPDNWVFKHFFDFLYLLGEKSPETAIKLITEIESKYEQFEYFVETFYPHLLWGLKESNATAYDKWRDENLKQKTLARILTYIKSLKGSVSKKDLEIILSIASGVDGFEFILKLEEEPQGKVGIYCLEAAIRLGDKFPELQKEIILHSLKLKGFGPDRANRVIDHLWIYKYDFSGWNESELKPIQDLFIKIADLQHFHIQPVLARLIDANPKIGLGVFDLRHKESKKQSEINRYWITPIEFDQELRESLKRNQEVYGEALLEKFLTAGDQAPYYLKRLIKNGLEEKTLEPHLKKSIEDGEIEPVIDLMREIGLSQMTIDLALMIVDLDAENHWGKHLLGFTTSGSVGGSGEFAIENAYQGRLDYFNTNAERKESLSSKQREYIKAVQIRLSGLVDHSHTSAIQDIKARKTDFEK